MCQINKFSLLPWLNKERILVVRSQNKEEVYGLDHLISKD